MIGRVKPIHYEPPELDEVVTVSEAAKRLKVEPADVRELMKSGEIGAHKETKLDRLGRRHTTLYPILPKPPQERERESAMEQALVLRSLTYAEQYFYALARQAGPNWWDFHIRLVSGNDPVPIVACLRGTPVAEIGLTLGFLMQSEKLQRRMTLVVLSKCRNAPFSSKIDALVPADTAHLLHVTHERLMDKEAEDQASLYPLPSQVFSPEDSME